MATSTLKSDATEPADSTLSPIMFCVCFAAFLVIALVAQTLTMEWRTWLPGAEGERSLIAGVKAAVYTFMSYIP
jgi:light-harvesting complex 1 beta chain